MHITGHASTIGKTLLFGAASATLYVLLYFYADALAAFCSQGGVSASVPIGICSFPMCTAASRPTSGGCSA